jgi:hypothetical protein
MSKRRSKKGGEDKPVEIPMTDLNWPDDSEENVPEEGAGDIYAAGTPGGGTASGGLAGTNVGHGDPDEADLEDALGNGEEDTAGEDLDAPPYSGHAGGAVGGTPAEKRAKGGHEVDPVVRRGRRKRGGLHPAEE